MSNVLVAKHPELSDGVALTGLSHNFSFGFGFPISTNFHLAKENRPELWGNYSTGILTWGDELALQYNFLKHPYFDPEVLAEAEVRKAPFAVSEFLTLTVPSLVAPNFTGPVLVSSRMPQSPCGFLCWDNAMLTIFSSLRLATQIWLSAEGIAQESWNPLQSIFPLRHGFRPMYSQTLAMG